MNRFELLPDEQIVIENPKHWKNYILPVLAMWLCLAAIALRLRYMDINILNELTGYAIIPEFAVTALSYIEVLTFLVMVAALAFALADIAYTRYYVTNKRIVATAGFLNVRQNEMMLERCETVFLSQKVSERVFNSGDILCISAGAHIHLDDVYDARRFKQTIMTMITKDED